MDSLGTLDPEVLHMVPHRAEATDHRQLLRDPIFANILLFRLWSQDDILSDYAEFQSQLDYIISLIQQQLAEG